MQGWQNERVLHRDGLSGYVLLVLPTDPAPHLKKVIVGMHSTVLRPGSPPHMQQWHGCYCLLCKVEYWSKLKLKMRRMDLCLQVKELAELLEEQLGLVHGWLISVPCKVGVEVITCTNEACQCSSESRLDI